jgi:PKD repeat protein
MIPCGIALSLKTVRLEVLDTYGLTDSATSNYVQIANTPPTAAFTVTPAVGDNTTYFEFDASSSSDAECATSSLEVRWDWEDDGTWDTLWSTIKTAGVTFGAAGYGWQTTRLEVRDAPGLTDTATDGVMIDHAPTASFTVSPTSGNVTTAFLFDPTSSTDPDVSYHSLHAQWDWEDDGTWDTPWLMCWETVTHTYDALGTYTVRLQVRQGLPSLSDSTTRQVQVVNTAPTAAFTVNPTGGDTNTVFQFDASSSSDLEDPVAALQVRWDYENDGTYDTAWSTTKTASAAYPAPGTYTVRLQVRDSGGLTHAATRQVTVQAPSANTPPNASFTVDPTSGDTNTVFQFDASSSNDAEDPTSALQVRWDWQNDGIFETGWRTGKTATHTFSTAGIHTVRLELRDTGGLTDAATRHVTVGELRFVYLPLVVRSSVD